MSNPDLEYWYVLERAARNPAKILNSECLTDPCELHDLSGYEQEKMEGLGDMIQPGMGISGVPGVNPSKSSAFS